MERMVTNRLRYFAESMHLLTEYQAGLRHGCSTEDQLLRLSQSTSDGLQQSPMQCTVVAFIDYSKAHDKVRRDSLLMMMSQKSIPSHMMRWNQTWLSNRPTRVTFDGVRSRTVTLKQGVPQRLVLSLLLFLFYIDNLASVDGAPQVSLIIDNVAM